jgi:hypothetical protein
MAKSKITCEECGREISTKNKLCPECNNAPQMAKAPNAEKTDDEPSNTSSFSMLRKVLTKSSRRNYKRAYIIKNIFYSILILVLIVLCGFAFVIFLLRFTASRII